MRKVYIEVKVRIIVDMCDDITVADTMDNMEHDFVSGLEGATVMDTEIRDYDIQDSK